VRFELAPAVESGGVAAPALPVTPAGQVRATAATVTVDLGTWVSRLRGRRVLATAADIERLVVTLVAADGQVYTQTMERAAIEAGQLRLTFSGLAVGAVNLRVVAEDASGNALTEVNETFTVAAGPNPPVSVTVPTGTSTSSGSSGGGALTPPSPSPFGPTNLDVALQAHDSFPTTPVPVTYPFDALITTDGKRPMAGTSFEMAWAASGDKWLLRNATEYYSEIKWNVSPGPTYDQGTGQILRLAPDGTLQAVLDGINARGLAVDGSGHLWASVWPKTLRKLAPDGTALGSWTLPNPVPYRGVLADASQVWAASGTGISRYTTAGALSGTTLLPGAAGAMAKDGASGDIWALAGNRVVKIAANGAIKATSGPISAFVENPYSRLAVGPDGHVWVTVHQEQRLLKLKPDGTIAARSRLEGAPLDLAVSASGEAWVSTQIGWRHHTISADYIWTKRVWRLSPDGVVQAAHQLADAGTALGFDADGVLWSAGRHLTKVAP
jgi:sugar lactone lactonase YvrE